MKNSLVYWSIRLGIGVCAILLFVPFTSPLRAANVSELKNQLQNKESVIAALEEEIKQYQKDIEETSKEANTFQTEVNRLNTTIKKLRADITITERRIEFTGILIEDLNLEIQEKEVLIQKDRDLLAEFIRELNDASAQSLVEILLANATLSDFFRLHFYLAIHPQERPSLLVLVCGALFHPPALF